MNKRLLIVVIGVTAMLGASAAAYGASSAGGGGIVQPLTIRTVQAGGHQEFLTINHDPRDQTGNEFIVSGPLLRPRSQQHVGRLRAVCVITTRRFGIAQCSMTAQFPAGDVAVAGALNFKIGTTSVLAVAGGTGTFKNARGQVDIHNISNSRAGLTFELIP